MSNTIQEEIIEGRDPTAEERELVEWAQEAVRKGLATVQDNLRLMVTLTSALLAGSAALIGQIAIAPGCKVIGVILLLIALAAALWGIYPREANVNVECPEEIKEERQRGLRFRMRCLRIANVCLLFAFAVILGGLIAWYKP